MVPSQGGSFQKMDSDQSGVFAPLMQFKCKGVVPKKFRFSGRWQCNIEFLLEEQHFEFMNGGQTWTSQSINGRTASIAELDAKFMLIQN